MDLLIEGVTMNRRLFAAGMAAMIPASVTAAQDATPDDETAPRAVLSGYLETIVRDGDVSAVPDYFDVDDINDVTREAVEMRNNITDDDPVTMEFRVICGDSEEAIALVRFWSNDSNSRDLFIAVRVRDGKIVGYNWMARPTPAA